MTDRSLPPGSGFGIALALALPFWAVVVFAVVAGTMDRAAHDYHEACAAGAECED